MPFIKCPAFENLEQGIKDYILSKKDMHIKEGMSESAAEKRAIEDFKKETVESLADVHSQLGNKVFEKVAEPEKVETETPPPEPPKEEKPTVHVERPKTELSFSGLQQVSNEFGYEDVKSRDRVSDLKEKTNAQRTAEEWAEKGEYANNVEDLLTRINNKELVPTAKQRLILQQHLANESGKLRNIKDKNSAEFDNQLNVVKRIKEIGLIARQEAGAALRIGENMGSHPLEDFADAFVAKQEANGVDVLTEQQKAEVAETVKLYEERTKVAEDKVSEMEAKMAEMEAQKEVAKKTTKPTGEKVTTKKTADDYKAERQAYKQELIEAKKEHEKWLKDQGIQSAGLGGLTLTPKMIKAVGKIIGSHVEEVGNNLADVTKKVYEEIKDVFVGITERDIHDIIAGEYAQKQPTRSQLVKDLTDLKSEAALLNKIEDVENGVPKTEPQRVEKNRRKKELGDQLKKLKKEKGYDDLSNLKELKKNNEEQTKKINERIDNKDFAEREKPTSIFDNKELQKKYPKEYKEALDAIREREDAKHEFDIQLLKDQNSRMSFGGKATELLSKGVGTVKAIVTGIDDSAVAIQTYVASIVRPVIGSKALGIHVSHAFSQKRFDRWLTELHNSSWWDLIKKSGLSVTEPTSLKAAEKEEIFNNRFSGTIKIKGKEYKLIDAPLKPFERAFTSLGNATRVLAFKNIASKYMSGKNPKTFESDPELFKSLAKRLNTETGRGQENKYVEQASKIVTLGIWSPKLMSTKFNILGISDLASLALSKVGTEGYYRKLHPRERIAAIKDVAQFVTTVAALSYLAAYMFGGEVDDDPLSSEFMNVKLDNGKSFNLTGGFSSYIRNIWQVARGKKIDEGKVVKANRINTALRFFRGKTPPITSSIINTADTKDYMGNPTSPLNEAKNVLLPISVKGIIKQMEYDGAGSLLTQGLPTFFGFNITDERDFPKKTKAAPSEPKTPKEPKEYRPKEPK